MEDREMSLEEAAKALAAMAERAGRIMKQEAQRNREESEKVMSLLKDEARRARVEAEQARSEADSLREEFEAVRAEMREQIETLQAASAERAADTQRSRRHAARAWGAVGVMGLAMLTGGVWSASSQTRSGVESAQARGQVQEARLASVKKDGQINALRGELETARTALARSEGELHVINTIKGGEKVIAAGQTSAAAAEAQSQRADDEAFLLFEFGLEPVKGDALVKDEPESAKSSPATQPVQGPSTQPVVSIETETVGAAPQRSNFAKLMDRVLGQAKW